MAFQECVIEIAQEQAEAWSDALFDLGALSVSVEDADADTPDEQPLFGEPGLEPTRLAWNRSRVVALFDEETDPALVVAAAANALKVDPVPPYELRGVEDQDWVRLTQSQFEPIRIGEKIWVVPSWHEAPDPDAVILELDPGLAFGTGSHPTTRLCMQWLEANVRAGETVLDYGCGSGILAIGAALHGSGVVDAVDIDPAAVDATNANAQVNLAHLKNAEGKTPINAGLPDLVGEAAQTYPVVLANILATPLKMLSPLLAAHVAPGGYLVLAGILARQEQELKDAYAEVGLQLQVANEEEGWILMTAQKTA